MTRYPDNSFDIVICSHVLEHIHEDKKAISEIARILKPNGEALILVPIPIGLEADLYDPSIEDTETRTRIYGQGDHVRMYSKSGLTDLICNSGLSIKTWSHPDDELGFEKMGLSSTSTLYVGVKRDASPQS
jgi:SAM-dependent methyltransferase